MVRGSKTIAAAFALLALGACKKSDSANDTTTVTSVNTDTAAVTNANAAPATPKMSDADIFAMLHAANAGEVAAGKTAQGKATDAAVKSFANDMVKDHSGMMSDGDALAKKLNVTPNMAAADSILKANDAMAGDLKNAAKGTAFDSTYVAGQVLGHQNTLAFIQAAQGAAQNADLKAALQGAQPKVQAHLDRIKGIQSDMMKKAGH